MLHLPDIFDYEDYNDPLINTVAWSINLKAQGYTNPSWQSLYRAFSGELKLIAQGNDDNAEFAKYCMKKLLL